MNRIEFVAENYVKEELIIKWDFLFGFIVMTIAGVLFGTPFYLLWHDNLPAFLTGEADSGLGIVTVIMMLAVLATGFVVHELIHAFFYGIFCKNKFKSVKIGVVFKKGYAYCECKEILRTKHFVVGLLMPTILLGIIPSIIAIFIGSFDLLFLGTIMCASGGSDILIFKKVAKGMNETWFENNVSIPAWYVYRPLK